MEKIGFKKKEQVEESKQEAKQEVQVQKKFYEMPWFWICITVIVMCLTKSKKIIICGNANGSGHANGNRYENSWHDIATKQEK
ncbi:MAG: hypothetical protein J6F30_16745 [Cellulosilyticum sp.]|nr:hypothetical protein [Cellulosilyticum sp.]